MAASHDSETTPLLPANGADILVSPSGVEDASPPLKRTNSKHHEHEPDLITFGHDDPADPRNWPRWRKWLIIGPVLLIDLSVSWGASGFSPAEEDFARDAGVSGQVATLGLSMYVLGLSLGPMTLAPLSESFGRSPVYIGSYFVYLCLLLATATAPATLLGFLPLRFLSGLFSSVTIANFGGSIADLFHTHDTGPAMSLYMWAATAGSPTGFLAMSFVAQRGGWRDVFWALLGVCSSFWVLMTVGLLIAGETRHSVILARRRKAGPHGSAAEEEAVAAAARTKPDAAQRRKASIRQFFTVSLGRPFRFLGTEAIIMFGAVYNGYLYGLSFLFNSAFSLIFGRAGHGFDSVGVGLCFLGITIGISLGPFTNIWQERYYQRRMGETGGRNCPEARVQLAKVAAVVFPLSLFCFAWTTAPSVHFIVPIIASAFWGWSFYTLIIMFAMYTEDSYRVYAASALAGLGLIRNMAGAGFPLFAKAFFLKEGFQHAGTVLACMACVLIPIPFILERHGPRLRRNSPWAREHMDDDEFEDSEDEVEA